MAPLSLRGTLPIGRLPPSDARKSICVHVDSDGKGVDEMATPGGIQLICFHGCFNDMLTFQFQKSFLFSVEIYLFLIFFHGLSNIFSTLPLA